MILEDKEALGAYDLGGFEHVALAAFATAECFRQPRPHVAKRSKLLVNPDQHGLEALPLARASCFAPIDVCKQLHHFVEREAQLLKLLGKAKTTHRT